jgi:hypothetical protein
VRLDYLAGANTCRAHPRAPVSAVENDTYSLQIRVPSSFGDVVGMTDVVSKDGALATDITACCHRTPPISLTQKRKAYQMQLGASNSLEP